MIARLLSCIIFLVIHFFHFSSVSMEVENDMQEQQLSHLPVEIIGLIFLHSFVPITCCRDIVYNLEVFRTWRSVCQELKRFCWIKGSKEYFKYALIPDPGSFNWNEEFCLFEALLEKLKKNRDHCLKDVLDFMIRKHAKKLPYPLKKSNYVKADDWPLNTLRAVLQIQSNKTVELDSDDKEYWAQSNRKYVDYRDRQMLATLCR